MSHNEEDSEASIALKATKYKPDICVNFGTAAKVARTVNDV
jgi:hypothetical protein